MEEKVIIESLSPIEKAILPNISESFTNLDEIAKNASQDKTTALRASAFLKNKGLIEEKTTETKQVILGVLGIHYLKNQLPERILLNVVAEKRELPISDIKATCNLNQNEAKIALGTLKKKVAVEIKNGKLNFAAKPGETSNKMLEELFLEKLPLPLESLEQEDRLALENLKSRKDIIEIEVKKITEIKLTALGKKISQMKLDDKLIEQLTPKMIKQNAWKGKKFRRYDLQTPVPRIFGGKRHFVNQAKDYAKDIWLEMGFREMTGNLAETSFWVFDTLFTAQDHPVREMQDTFYLKNVIGKIPERKNKKEWCMVSSVQKAHEGGLDKSSGWKYSWNENDSKKVLLRTHTTCLSAKKLLEIGQQKEFPAKYFALGKCFRNETVDWSHGFEFNQTEGIVIDENANFRQLLGYLKEFYKKMGFEKVRFRPGYFAYTEPSLEVDVFHPVKNKWLEFGGA